MRIYPSKALKDAICSAEKRMHACAKKLYGVEDIITKAEYGFGAAWAYAYGMMEFEDAYPMILACTVPEFYARGDKWQS